MHPFLRTSRTRPFCLAALALACTAAHAARVLTPAQARGAARQGLRALYAGWLLAIASLCAWAAPAWAASEFRVNTTTINSQYQASVAALAGGGFVVTWSDYSQSGGDTSRLAVRAQVFASNGSTTGSAFLVNTTTNDSQYASSVAALAGGGFVVAWTDESESGGDTSGYAVRARVFADDGSPSSSEFLVNTATLSEQSAPSVAALTGGGFVVAWTDDSRSVGDTNGYAVRAQVFAANGSPSGAEFLVNTSTANGQSMPSVAALVGDGFVVAWTDHSASGGDTSGAAVRAQVFAAGGSPIGSEFRVNTTTANSQYAPSVAALAGGGFVVAWTDDSRSADDTSGYAVRAQVFAADRSTTGSEFLVNTTRAGNQQHPRVTALAGGGFLAAWSDDSESGSDTSRTAVRAQVFEAGGSPSGSEFLVNTTTTNIQKNPSIAALAGGSIAIAWDGYGTGDAEGVFARLFTAPPTLSATGVPGAAQPTFSGKALAGSTVTVMDGVTVLGTTTADAVTGAWSWTPAAPLPLGARSITATADNAATGQSAPSATLSLSVAAAPAGAYQAIPTLGEWGLLLLSLLAGLLGWRSLRAQTGSSSEC